MATQTMEQNPEVMTWPSVEALGSTQAKTGETRSKTTIEILTQVAGAVPTTRLVFKMAQCMAVYRWRPVFLMAASGQSECVKQTA